VPIGIPFVSAKVATDSPIETDAISIVVAVFPRTKDPVHVTSISLAFGYPVQSSNLVIMISYFNAGPVPYEKELLEKKQKINTDIKNLNIIF
jgi:hypothetical protein